jgi:hypothetical protein
MAAAERVKGIERQHVSEATEKLATALVWRVLASCRRQLCALDGTTMIDGGWVWANMAARANVPPLIAANRRSGLPQVVARSLWL